MKKSTKQQIINAVTEFQSSHGIKTTHELLTRDYFNMWLKINNLQDYRVTKLTLDQGDSNVLFEQSDYKKLFDEPSHYLLDLGWDIELGLQKLFDYFTGNN